MFTHDLSSIIALPEAILFDNSSADSISMLKIKFEFYGTPYLILFFFFLGFSLPTISLNLGKSNDFDYCTSIVEKC